DIENQMFFLSSHLLSKATLVCLASGFYPDHMKLFWKVNGAERTEGVGTDEFSTQNEGTYSLTSRLRISAQEWFNPLNRFECVATFFKNGTLESINKFIYGDAVMLVSKIYVGVEHVSCQSTTLNSDLLFPRKLRSSTGIQSCSSSNLIPAM
uniref:Ig-like domain-containing protein n=1 Tax=Athene cunicularia TaxID=194338 RepID=A0A663M5H8_ATHCN